MVYRIALQRWWPAGSAVEVKKFFAGAGKGVFVLSGGRGCASVKDAAGRSGRTRLRG